jgi:hypothetical protein
VLIQAIHALNVEPILRQPLQRVERIIRNF